MRTMLARFLRDESGSTTIEYTLIAAGIAIAILTALNALGGSLGGLFETLDGTRSGPAPAAASARLHGPEAPDQGRDHAPKSSIICA